MEMLYLSRRNLLTLLAKLDQNVAGDEPSACTLIKSDNEHPKYPQTMERCAVQAIEDDEYYAHRQPGAVTAATRAEMARQQRHKETVQLADDMAAFGPKNKDTE